jgi:CrtC N-terminal lipocalin domain
MLPWVTSTSATAQELDGQTSATDALTQTEVANALWQLTYKPGQIPAGIRSKLNAPLNSNANFGSRSTFYLNERVNEPISFTPNYLANYANLALYNSSVNDNQAQARNAYLGEDRSTGFRDIPMPGPGILPFPQSDAMDLEAQFGWYYAAGNVVGEDGKQYGVMLMLLSTPILPPATAKELGLTDTENESTQLQLEINQGNGFHYEARPTHVAGTTGLLQFKPNTFFSVMGKNRMESLRKGQFFPMRMQALGWDFSTTPPTQMKVDVVVSSGSKPLLEGNLGCLPCCGGIGTLYYSIPRMTVDPSRSSIAINGKKIKLKSGTFWLDHQWGTTGDPKQEVVRAAINLAPGGPGGWDFFPMNFTGNRAMVVYFLHTAAFTQFYGVTDDQPKPGTMTVPIKGQYVDANDNATQISGSLSVTDWVSATTTPDPARYPVTHVWHPNKWVFTFADPTAVPTDLQNLTMTPITTQPSTLFFSGGVQYQEAPSNVTNGDNVVVGTGYGESTGYAGIAAVKANSFALAGLPNTPSLFLAPGPSAQLISDSLAFVTANADEAAAALAMCTDQTNTDGADVDDEMDLLGRYSY